MGRGGDSLEKKYEPMLRLKIKRIEKGLTQKELADMVGIAKNTLCAYEIGFRHPKKSTLEKIAYSLGCEMVELR